MARNNKVTLIGRLGKEPFKSEDGSFMAFTLATNETYPELDDKGNIKGYNATATQWHNIIVFNDNLIEGNKSLEKGALVKIRGSIQYREVKGSDFSREASIVAKTISLDI